MGRRDRLKLWLIEGWLGRFLGIGNFGSWSEKGSSREDTENRVTSWTFMFWGNLENLRCFTKRIFLGEFENGFF
jgi:hypothetical protein